jgi:hypothetical protein
MIKQSVIFISKNHLNNSVINMQKKRCPMCGKEIAYWESACCECWNKLTLEQQNNLRIFNDAREICRECGFDPIDDLHW